MPQAIRKRDLLRWFIELMVVIFTFSEREYLFLILFFLIIAVIEYQEYQLVKITMRINITNDNIESLADKTKTKIRTKMRGDLYDDY